MSYLGVITDILNLQETLGKVVQLFIQAHYRKEDVKTWNARAFGGFVHSHGQSRQTVFSQCWLLGGQDAMQSAGLSHAAQPGGT